MHTIKKALITACATAFIAGCGGDSRVTNAELSEVPPVNPVFSPSQSKLPFPTDILFSGTVDGSINVPGKANTDSSTVLTGLASAQYGDPQTALNTMDGFGTTSNASVSFSGAVRGSTLEQGVRIYKAASVDAATKTVTDLGSELVYGVDFVVGNPGGTAALIIPLQPLEPSSTYLVAVTNDVLATDGDPIEPSQEYALVKGSTDLSSTPYASLEPLRQQTNVHEGLIAADGDINQNEPSADIAVSFSFTTENIGGALAQAKAIVEGAAAPSFVDLTSTPGGLSDTSQQSQPGGLSSVYMGLLAGTQQFLDPDVTDPLAYKYGTWIGDTAVWDGGAACSALSASNSEHLVGCNYFTPDVQNSGYNIPVMVTVPDDPTGCPVDLPVAIYQHGITSNRATIIALGDALAQACTVGIAIDMPKHGIQPNDPTFGGFSLGTSERLVQPASADTADCQNPTDADTASGVVYCKSGDYYVNLESLPNARDTIRQSVVDLQSVYQALVNNGDSSLPVTIDENNIHFVGISLGAIVGQPFVAQQPGVKTVSLNVGAGGIAKVLDGSPTFEPVVTAGLKAAAGINKPSGDYEGFLLVAQTLLDNTDPMNFTDEVNAAEGSAAYWLGAAGASGSARAVLFQEVVGETQIYGVDCSSVSCPDQVLPNNVFGQSGLTEAWNASTFSNQITHLPNQAPLTQPVALSGTDPLTQGTAFLANAQNGILDPLSTALPLDLFYGLNLPQVDSSGGSGSGVVRFTAGTHSSLLDPTPSGATTQLMQTQIATFVATGGTTVAADPNAGGAGQVVQD